MIHTLHRANFLRVAQYLESERLKARFTMARICDEELLHAKAKAITCGSVGDVLGHGPYAGVPKLPSESWGTYRIRAFGVSFDTPAYRWLYAALWAIKDNSPQSAAWRIRLYIDNDGVPEHWESLISQKKGTPNHTEHFILCYENNKGE